jgi:hypothetical protein
MGEESKGMIEASEEMVRVIERRREATEECKNNRMDGRRNRTDDMSISRDVRSK